MSKKPENKYDPSFVHPKVIRAISDVRQYGITKHGNRDDWFTTHPNEHYKSAMRHLLAAMSGESIDLESGLPHLALCLTNLCFELERDHLCFDRAEEVTKEQTEYDLKVKTIIIK